MSRLTGYLCGLLLCLCPALGRAGAGPGDAAFQAGVAAYAAGNYSAAAREFSAAAGEKPACGTYQNLGLAAWQEGRVGPAILAWERALWLCPSAREPRANLQLARSISQLEAPQLAWYELVSIWLPAGGWAILTAVSLWVLADLLALPGILRYRRAVWHQTLAALALTLFLLTLPAHWGWHTRSRIGFVLEPNTPLRLTPTDQAQEITRVGAGEPGRCERVRGNYCYVRFRYTAGWLTRDEFALITGR